MRYYESSFSKGIKSLSKNGIGMEVSLSFSSPAGNINELIVLIILNKIYVILVYIKFIDIY